MLTVRKSAQPGPAPTSQHLPVVFALGGLAQQATEVLSGSVGQRRGEWAILNTAEASFADRAADLACDVVSALS